MTAVMLYVTSLSVMSQPVVLHGKVQTEGAKFVEFQNLKDSPFDTYGSNFKAKVDDNGQFNISIPVDKLAFGQINCKNFYHEIALAPGDQIEIEIDGDEITYKGRGADKNTFLLLMEREGLWDRSIYDQMRKKLSLEDYNSKLVEMMALRAEKLSAAKIKSQAFVARYNIESEVVFNSALSSYPMRYGYEKGLNMDSVILPAAYQRVNSFTYISNDKFVISENYLSSFRNALYAKAQEIRRYDKSLDFDEALQVALLDSLGGKTKEYVLATYLKSDLSRNNYDSALMEKFYALTPDEVSMNAIKQAISKFEEKASLINQPLNEAFNRTELYDTLGQKLTFEKLVSNHRGKVLYLDFWGIGCGPCRQAMPYAKMLKEKLSGEDVEFLYLSMEWIPKNAWDKVFEVTKTNKNHYVLHGGWNNGIFDYMEMKWVPQYMIIDKEGRLVDFTADRPTPMIEKGETDLEKRLRALANM